MAVADTAKLIASLELKDQLSAGVKTATGAIGTLETKFGSLGNALGHAKSQIGGLLSGPLGLLGLGGGIYGIEQIISKSLTKVDQLGEAIEKVTGVTGMSATAASMFVAVFSRFGLDADKTATSLAFMEKALGNLTKTAGTEKTFVTEFGFALRDTAGNVKDAQTVFEDLADYWVNTSIPQSQKAALAAKLLGKGYVDLVPALNEGAAGIKAIEQTARDLGLVMDAQSMGELAKYHESMEKLGMATGALELAIGLGLAPAMTQLAEAATDWIKNGGTQQIRDWLQSAAGFAKTLGAVFKDDVVPAFGWLSKEWSKVPDDLKKLLIGGVVAQKASSWLFGGGGLFGAIAGLGKGAVGTVASQGASKLAPQNVFVTNWAMIGGGALKPGPGGLPLAAAGGGSAIATIAEIAIPVALTAFAGYLASQLPGQIADQNKDAAKAQQEWMNRDTTPQQNIDALRNQMKVWNETMSNPINIVAADIPGTGVAATQAQGLKDAANKIANGTSITPEGIRAISDAITFAQSAGQGGIRDAVPQLQEYLKQANLLMAQQTANGGQPLPTAPKPTPPLTATDKDTINQAANVAHADVMAQLRGNLDATKAIQDGAAIAKVYGTGTATSLQWVSKNIRELTAIQQAFAATGDTATAATIGADIAIMRDALAGKLDQVVTAVGSNPLGTAPSNKTTHYAPDPPSTGSGPDRQGPIHISVNPPPVSSRDMQRSLDTRIGLRGGVPQ